MVGGAAQGVGVKLDMKQLCQYLSTAKHASKVALIKECRQACQPPPPPPPPPPPLAHKAAMPGARAWAAGRDCAGGGPGGHLAAGRCVGHGLVDRGAAMGAFAVGYGL